MWCTRNNHEVADSERSREHCWCRTCYNGYFRERRALGKTSTDAQRNWRAKNQERKVQNNANYLARKRTNAPIDSDITLDKVYARDLGICKLCNTGCHRSDASIDHSQPVSRGGSHTWDNVQLAHFICNARKGNKTMEEWNHNHV